MRRLLLRVTLTALVLTFGYGIGSALWPVVDAQAPALLFGTLSGAPKAVAVDTNGYLQVGLASGVVACANGGTGLSSYAIGDLLYASAACTLAKLADVATGRVLVSGGVGVAPAWSAAPTVTSITAASGGNCSAPPLGLTGGFGLYTDGTNFTAICVAGSDYFQVRGTRIILGSSSSQIEFGSARILSSSATGLISDGAYLLGTATGSGGAYVEGWEQSSDPGAPAANSSRIFFKDNGAGKTQACARFPTGATQCFATEP